jgi:hypothetical protein
VVEAYTVLFPALCAWTALGSSANRVTKTFAMVDAREFGGDICARIRASIIQTYYSGGPNYNYGIVVDARGVGPGTIQSCSDSPWDLSVQPPATVVLLPSGTITISNTWTMPAQARLVGEGPGLTLLKATFSGADMIDMGNSTLCPPGSANDCPAIVIEHLALSGNSHSAVNGIVNNNAQELSYVNDVSFSNITGTALSLASQFTWNSGPYTNLTMSDVGTCVNIDGPPGTRGIHGLTCGTNSSSGAAIYLNASNNSLEDISLSGSNTDGIQIGGDASALAHNNVLFNIRGTGFTNLIHIENNTGTTNCPGQTSVSGPTVNNVCDITILGVTNGSGNTVYDQVSNTTLTDSNLGMYILGEPVQYGTGSSTNNVFLGYSHFTTSLNWPTWLVGTTQPSPLTSCPSVGSLYSVTSGAAPTLLECESSGWQTVY